MGTAVKNIIFTMNNCMKRLHIKLFQFSLLAVLFLFTSSIAYSQSNPLEKNTTLQVQNTPLEQVLANISKQTGVRFSYNSQIVNPKTKVSVHVQNKTVKEVLALILPAEVSYKIVGEHIVFYATPLKKNNITQIESPPNTSFAEIIEKNELPDNGKPADDCLNSVSVAEGTMSLQKDTLSLTREEDMKAQIAGLMLAVATASAPIAAQDTISVQQQVCKPAQLTFFYPLGTGLAKSSEKCYHFSVNILGGVTGELKGLEAGGLFNINKYGAAGAQFAGLFNVTRAGDSEITSANAQFAGIFNYTRKGISAQFAGIFNHGDTAYLQAGGIYNITHRSYAQFAGIFNIANKTGAQFSGIFNHGDTAHFQAAGIWNTAKQTKCQFSGIANRAQESYCQIAGIVNITKKGGFQMGLINVRDTVDGVSLGLINIVKHGGVLEAGIEAGEFVHTALTFRSGVPRLYSIISVGYNYTDNFFAVGSGLGTSFKLVGNLGLNLELAYATLYNTKSVRFNRTFSSLVQLSPVLNYRFAKHFKMYLGPTLNFLIQNRRSTIKVPYSIYHGTIAGPIYNYPFDIWIGVVGGIKF